MSRDEERHHSNLNTPWNNGCFVCGENGHWDTCLEGALSGWRKLNDRNVGGMDKGRNILNWKRKNTVTEGKLNRAPKREIEREMWCCREMAERRTSGNIKKFTP